MRSAPLEGARAAHAPSAPDHQRTQREREPGDVPSPIAAPHDAATATALAAEVLPAAPVAVSPRTTVSRPQGNTRRRYLLAKRAVDVVGASVLLVLVSPLLVAIPVAIKLDSPGPALFRQQRIRGRQMHGGSECALEPFSLYKFRTMVANADPSLHQRYIEAYIARDEAALCQLRPGRGNGDSYRPLRDPRVTRVGAVLRKLSLDELPQLWNVLRGEMSLVGPRPPLPYEVAMYGERDMQRLTTPQGITGLAQVRGRCSIGFDDLIRCDLEYVASQSIWLDLKVLALTLPVVLSRRGAD
jgi:lipopolysaccharide/colanic/teichoic acid biosynthesis glycosyltransferase